MCGICGYQGTFKTGLVRRMMNLIAHRGPDDSGFFEDPANQVAAIYRDADIFIFASSCENCPITLLEAMSCASVMACSDFAFNREFAKDAALYFNLDDVNSLIDVLLKLIQDKQLRENLAKKAYSYASNFDWETNVKRKAEFFKNVIKDKNHFNEAIETGHVCG